MTKSVFNRKRNKQKTLRTLILCIDLARKEPYTYVKSCKRQNANSRIKSSVLTQSSDNVKVIIRGASSKKRILRKYMK